MKMCVKAISTIAVICMPVLLFAQDDGAVADGIHSMQSVLDNIYDEMIPLCENLIDVGRGIAGFAALWYIASRVWRSLANAEPIDFYPLLRPFAICIAIGFFSGVIGLIRGVMEPTVSGTNAMLEDSQKAVATLLQQKEEAVKQTEYWQMYVGETGSGDYDKWYKYTYPGETVDDESWTDVIGNDIKFALAKASYNFRNAIKQWMADVLDILYEAAALCVNTIRTFILVILSILGPLVFGLSVFDGFQHTLTSWLARYINIFLWLPVANILGTVLSKIQENMLQIDIDQVQATGDTFFSSTDAGYLIFMVIGIVSYFTVPTVANWIVQAGGHNALLVKTTNMSSSAAGDAVSMTGAAGTQFLRDLGNDMGKVGGK
ncbi:conjugative transposon protein TraJ [Panacibacter ginsenosidivorans]|uniref:Conjugative transposon protein TraJ n=1 Tax=Panacibacter ginsenosidivorans TaxID=1813871 RepID=A0A5B8VFG7_9BACT|nr:conjugative transposon protein TraJ [Panacibacter ginsenosidivorans]QEC69276.1 conjugative transposon protein TraJ [Panacibacter ginsenosidivorans]